MGWNVLVRNGVLQLQDPGPPLSFLRSQPLGAYTTTRSTNNAANLLLWERHMERLSQSVQLLSKEMPHFFPSDPMEFPCFVEHVKFLLQPSLQMGLAKALDIRNDCEELLVMAYITGERDNIEEKIDSDISYGSGQAADQDYKGFQVFVHISRCIPLYSESESMKPIRVAIMGRGRFLPNAKHTDWIRTRQALEKSRPDDATEIILSNDGDLLLEGMVTNFFVVVSRKASAEVNTCLNKDEDWRDLVLQTAPLKGVLPGVVRKLILEICDEYGITCELLPPSWRGRQVWMEAFTTNSVRLIQPVGFIRGPMQWDIANDTHHLQNESLEDLILQTPGRLTEFIKGQILDKAAMYSTSVKALLKVSL